MPFLPVIISTHYSVWLILHALSVTKILILTDYAQMLMCYIDLADIDNESNTFVISCIFPSYISNVKHSLLLDELQLFRIALRLIHITWWERPVFVLHKANIKA